MGTDRPSRRWPFVAAAAVLLIHQPLGGADILVQGDCTLVEAINAANNDDDSGGLCPPGGAQGHDRLVLTGDVLLTEAHHTSLFGGDDGLPVVRSTITVEGNGFTVARDPAAPDFRIFDVGSGGDLDLENVTVSGGGDVTGSALLTTYRGIAVLVESTLSGNSGGSAAYVWDPATYGGFILTIQSTISGNDGTGIGNYNGLVKLVSSTVSGNGVGSSGDGIWNGGLDSHLILESTTIAGSAGVGLYNAGQTTEIKGIIVTGSGDSDCAGPVDIAGGSDSMDGDGSCPEFGDLTGFDPVLADNGGSTETHALLEGSSAIDNAGLCGVSRDQRGLPRVGDCDSGSYEFQGPPEEGIRGTASGLVTLSGACSNRDTGDSVDIPQQSLNDYSCEGLSAETGDAVFIQLRGAAQQTAVRGSVEELILFKVNCTNLTTGQRVSALRNSTQWHCSSAGFTAGVGDRLLLEIKGSSR